MDKSTKEVAQILHVSPSYLRDLISKGVLLPHAKTPGGYWQWNEQDIANAKKILTQGTSRNTTQNISSPQASDPAKVRAQQEQLVEELRADYAKILYRPQHICFCSYLRN